MEETRRTAQALGTEHQESVVTDRQVLHRVLALLAGIDQPLADYDLVPLHVVAEQVRSEVKVAVCGGGARGLVGGHRRHRRLWRSGQDGRTLPAPLAVLRGRLNGPALSGGVSQNGFAGDLVGPLNGAPADPATRQLKVLNRPRIVGRCAAQRRGGTGGSLQVRALYLDRELASSTWVVSDRTRVRDGAKALLRTVLAQSAPEVTARYIRSAPRVATAASR